MVNATTQIPAAVQFTQLPSGSAPTGAEVFCVVQNGSSVQIPAASFSSVFATVGAVSGIGTTTGLSIIGVANAAAAIPSAITATTANTILGLNAAGTQLAFTTIPIGLTTIAGLSVLGVTGAGNTLPAAITGAAAQALVVNDAGNALAFGKLNLGSSAAVTGVLSTANLPVAGSAAFGIVEPDNVTITVSGGVLSAVSGGAGNVVATSPLNTAALVVSLGTTRLTTIAQGINGQLLLGSTSANPLFQTMSSDATITNLGVLSLTTNVARLNIQNQTVSGGAVVSSLSLGSIGTATMTVNCGSSPLMFLTNNAAMTFASPLSDGNTIVLVTNAPTAGPIGFNGFSVGSNTGDAYVTTNAQKFSIFFWRINGVSGYRWAAHQ